MCIRDSFYTVYLLQNVKVGYTYITALSLLNIPCMIIFTPLWRKVISRTGSWFKMIQIAMTGYLVNYVLLALVTPCLLYTSGDPCGKALLLAWGDVVYPRGLRLRGRAGDRFSAQGSCRGYTGFYSKVAFNPR